MASFTVVSSDSVVSIALENIFWTELSGTFADKTAIRGDLWTVAFIDSGNRILKQIQIPNPLHPVHELYSPDGKIERRTLTALSASFMIRTIVSTDLRRIQVFDSSNRKTAELTIPHE